MWHDLKQNSEDPCPCCGKTWMELRKGKVTGSSISKVMANIGKPFGDPAKRLAVQIAVHELGGNISENSYSNYHMERGHEQEPIAKRLYEDTYFCNISNGGFYEGVRTGASPDGHIKNGLIEVKSVEEPAHYACIKRNGIDPAYKWQVIFELMQSGLDFIDYVSYCAYFPKDLQLLVYRIHRKDVSKDIELINDRLKQFFGLVDSIKLEISAVSYPT